MTRAIERVLLCSMAVPWPEHTQLCAFHHDQAKALHELGTEMRLFSPVPKLPRIMGHLNARLRRQVARPRRYRLHGVLTESPGCYWAFSPFVRHQLAQWCPETVAKLACLAVRRALLQTIEQFRPDVLLGHGMMPWGRLLQEVARETGIPFAIIEHSAGDVLRMAEGKALTRHYLEVAAHAQQILVVGVGMQQHLERMGVSNAQRIVNGARWPSAVQLQRPRPAELRNRTLVLSAANYDRRKGFEELVAAFQRVAQVHPEAMLVLVTDAGRKLRRLVAKSGLGDCIRILPRMPQSDLLQWMVWADLFAMPSRLEAFGLVYVEAMAAGTPVLMSTDCGLAPQLRLASSEPTVMQHGWGVVPDCAATIENALQEALRDRERLAAMGHAARAFVLPRFTWRENAMQLLAALGGHAPCALEFAEEVACP